MQQTAKMTPFQFYTVLFLSRVFSMVTYVAGVRETLSATDEVIAAVLTGVFLFVTSVPVLIFLRQGDSSSLITRAESVSSVFAKILCVIYLADYLYFGVITAVRFGIFTGSVMFPDTNVLFFIAVMLLASSYIVLKGVESMGRSAVIILIPVAAALVFVFATQSEAFDWLNFTHPFTSSVQDIFSSGFYSASRTGELAFVMLLTPFVKKQKGKHVLRWILAVSVVIVITEIVLAGVLGGFGSTQLFSMYSLSVLAEFGFIERLDAIITCMWLLCAAVKIAVTLFLCETLLSSLIKKRCRKTYIFVSAAVILVCSVPLANNIGSLTALIRSPLAYVFYLSTVCVIPLIVIFAEKIKRRRCNADC